MSAGRQAHRLSRGELALVVELTDVTYLQIIPRVFETLFFGILTFLVGVAIYVLGRNLRTTKQRILLAVLLWMYSWSIIEWAIDIRLMWLDLQIIPQILSTGSLDVSFPPEVTGITAVDIIASAINVVTGDLIVLWRACVIYNWRKAFIIPSCVLVVPVIVNWMLACINTIRTVSLDDQPFGNAKAITILAYTSSLVLNIWATSAIAVISLRYRQRVRAHLESGRSGTTKLGGVLALLVESGVGYIVIWVIFYASAFNAFGLGPSQGIQDCVTMLIPMYPVIVVLLVALYKLPGEHNYVRDPADRPEAPRSAIEQRRVLSGIITQTNKDGSVFMIGQSFDSAQLNTTVEYHPYHTHMRTASSQSSYEKNYRSILPV